MSVAPINKRYASRLKTPAWSLRGIKISKESSYM